MGKIGLSFATSLCNLCATLNALQSWHDQNVSVHHVHCHNFMTRPRVLHSFIGYHKYNRSDIHHIGSPLATYMHNLCDIIAFFLDLAIMRI